MLASVVDTMLAKLCTTIYCFLEGVGGVRYVAFCLSFIVLIIPSFASGRLCFVSVAFPVNFHLYFSNTVDNKFENTNT